MVCIGGSALKIFTGNAHKKLAEDITKNLEIPMGEIQITRFPDGEISVKIMENIRGMDVYIIQPVCFPPNENLMELLIIIDAMRRASAARITAVIPYYGYARQDRKDRPRVPITAKLIANLLVAAGTSRLLTMDLHAQQIQGFFDIPVDHLHAAPVIVKFLKDKKLVNPVVVSPDPGGMKMAYAYSRMLSAELAIVAKQRKSANEVETFNVVGNVEGHTAILVDDLISTGGTLCSAAELLMRKGAIRVLAAATHPVFVPESFRRLAGAPIEEYVVTDSIPLNADRKGLPVTVLSIAELLGEAICRIHNNQSVSSLFKVE